MLRRRSSGRGGMQFAGAFLISRLGGSRRRFGRTIALWGLNRFLLFAAPSVWVPPDQSTHRPCIVLPRQRRRNRPDKPKTLNHLPAAKRLRPSRLLFHWPILGEISSNAVSGACAVWGQIGESGTSRSCDFRGRPLVGGMNQDQLAPPSEFRAEP
jgi:hypothetical protein